MGRKSIVFILLFSILTPIFTYFPAQTAFADFDCLTLNVSSSASDKAYCQNELNQIEAELNTLLAEQAAQAQQTGTLKGDVDYLNSQIKALQAKIKAQELIISETKVAIVDKTNTITSLAAKIDSENQSLAQLLRNTNEFDNENIINLILSDNTISDFYSDLESYDSIQNAVKSSVDVINGVKAQTETAKTQLQQQQNAETDAQAELENAQNTMAKSEASQAQLLAISKQKESAYQALAAQKKAQADSIRSALFSLAGTSQQIDFGTALQYANEAHTETGIDPAFLLAIIKQESTLGANVGQCYLTDPDTGAGVGKNTGTTFPNVMAVERNGDPSKGDVQPFLAITNALGFNAYQTAVSCPIAGVNGYGGAMGPAQFIPSTWFGYISTLQTALGHYPNPWAAEDAFLASATLLTDKGAAAGGGGGIPAGGKCWLGGRGGGGGGPLLWAFPPGRRGM